VRNEEKGGAVYPLEPDAAPFKDFGDPHDRPAARSGEVALPGQRARPEVRRVRHGGHRRSRRGVQGVARRLPAAAPPVARQRIPR